MIALVLCGLIAGAFAAPQFDFRFGFPQRPQPFLSNYHTRSQFFDNENVFDTGRFWNDLSKELHDLDDMLADFSRRFPTSVANEGVVGNEYKITISLPDFDEKDIVVKARKGLLMIQANHKYAEGSERNYLDVRTLPDNVNVTGNWIFERGVLKITFPLMNETPVYPSVYNVPMPTTEQPMPSTTMGELLPRITTEEPMLTTTLQQQFNGDTTTTTIQTPYQGSREEIEPTDSRVISDVDVGLGRGDLGREYELKTNEIPDGNTVEATTYAVDLKDEVEFVPVRY